MFMNSQTGLQTQSVTILPIHLKEAEAVFLQGESQRTAVN